MEAMFRNGFAIWTPVVKALCCFALLLVAFAHTPGLSPSPTPAYASSGSAYEQIDLAAYTLPDGSLPSLCLYNPGNGGKRNAAQIACDFCQIASGANIAGQNDHDIISQRANASNLAHHYQFVDYSRQDVGACGKTGPPLV